MHSFITPKPKLEQEALAINNFLQEELKTSPDDIQSHGDEIELRGNKISIYVSRTGAMLADAKYHLNESLKSDILVTLIQQMQGTYLSASAQKEFIRSACTYETWLVDYIERLHKTSTHLLDWYRSLLSKYKEELNYSRGVSGSYNP
jgi:hypothetical protein